MPDTVKIYAKIECPQCGIHLLNSVRCSWGAVPGLEYKLGDDVKWLRGAAGDIVGAFELQKVGKNLWRWNCGGPDTPNVDVFDEDIYTGNHHVVCHGCGAEVAACVVVVRENKFVRILAIEASDVDAILGASKGRASVAVLNDDGSFSPREDWFDCPVVYKSDQ